jgi:hypothetical protein
VDTFDLAATLPGSPLDRLRSHGLFLTVAKAGTTFSVDEGRMFDSRRHRWCRDGSAAATIAGFVGEVASRQRRQPRTRVGR